MISPFAIALATILPPIFGLWIISTVLWLKSRHDHFNEQSRAGDERIKIEKLEKRLAAFPKAWNRDLILAGSMDTGFSNEELRRSFMDFYWELELYVDKWVPSWGKSRVFHDESPERIERLIFPKPQGGESIYCAGKGPFFPNHHQYTTAELVTFFGQEKNRQDIVRYILASILQNAISIEGNPKETLLPLNGKDIYGLNELHKLAHKAKLGQLLSAHISKFGFYYTENIPEREDYTQHMEKFKKERFVTFVEELLQPYRNEETIEDKEQRLKKFDDLLNAAIQHGMHVIGYPYDYGTIEYQWGEREDGGMIRNPALCSLLYKDGKKINRTLLKRLWDLTEVIHQSSKYLSDGVFSLGIHGWGNNRRPPWFMIDRRGTL